MERVTGLVARIRYGGRFRAGDVRHSCADMRRFSEAFGALRITALETGLRSYLDWFGQQRPAALTLLTSALEEMASVGLLKQSRA
jgi:hypothetical protein